MPASLWSKKVSNSFSCGTCSRKRSLQRKAPLKRTLDPPDGDQIINPNSTLAKILRVALIVGLVAGLVLLILQIIHLENILSVETEYGEFAWVPPGSFTMGSPATDAMRYDDETPHMVRLTLPMYIAKTELAQEHYTQIFNHPADNPSLYPGIDFPVDSVSWDEADAFIGAINQQSRQTWETQARMDGLVLADYEHTRLYDTWRLPTESEWEYAARAGTESVLPVDLDDRTWYSATSELTTHPASEKSFNEWGLYDMNGNVPEWVADWFDAEYPASPAIDPVVRTQQFSPERVMRGGAFYDQLRPVRPANRDSALPTNGDKYSGFRLVYQPYPLPYDPLELPKIEMYFKMKEWYRGNYKQIAQVAGNLVTSGLEMAGLGSDEAEAIGNIVEEDISGQEAPADDAEAAPAEDDAGGS